MCIRDRAVVVPGTIKVSSLATFENGMKVSGPVQESFVTYTSSSGVVTVDVSNAQLYLFQSPSANWTINFSNLGLDQEYAKALSMLITQGSTAYIPNAVQIAGSAQTIVWQGGSAPSGTANGKDLVSFTIYNDGGTYTVLGQLVSYS